jgi:hypothetical protein
MWFWARVIVGVLLLLLGLVWIGQGLNVIKGSFMTGNGLYAVAGMAVALGGLWLLWGPARTIVRH